MFSTNRSIRFFINRWLRCLVMFDMVAAVWILLV